MEEDKKIDWCSSFPEYWYQWYLYRGVIPAWRKVYIGDLCKSHDNVGGEGCAATSFAKGLYERKIVVGWGILLGATAACWYMYPKTEFDSI